MMESIRRIPQDDRRAASLLLVLCLACYGYFFQGDGWTLQSHFATIRSLVEHHTFVISTTAADTGDVAVMGEYTYSNKPPGLALLGMIPYSLISWVERLAGFDLSAKPVILANQYILTLALCGVPATTAVLMLYFRFRRDGAGSSVALVLSSGFALGSWLWPYSGMMFNHLMVMSLLLGAWLLVTLDCRQGPLVAGGLLGIAGLCEYLVWPLVGAFMWARWLQTRRPVQLLKMALPALIALLGLLLYQWLHFGHILTPSYAYDNPMFQHPALLFGKFHFPAIERLFYITLHPARGLFWSCPVFLIPFLGISTSKIRATRLDVGRSLALAIVGYFILFVACYAFWLGGWGVGIRFLIPALPFGYLFVHTGFQRFPRVCVLLILISILNMFAVTAVRAHFPGDLTQPSAGENPLSACWSALLHGDVAQGRDAFNLATLVGVRGAISLLPIVILILTVLMVGMVWYRRKTTAVAGQRGATNERAA